MKVVSPSRRGKKADEVRFIASGSMLTNILDDNDVRKLIHNLMETEDGTTIETIYLDNDVTYATNETVIWVKRSVTIDGQNHTISGYGKRGARYVTISIYPDEGTYTAPLNVTLKNIKASHNAATGRSLELFHYDSNVELNIDNCECCVTNPRSPSLPSSVVIRTSPT